MKTGVRRACVLGVVLFNGSPLILHAADAADTLKADAAAAMKKAATYYRTKVARHSGYVYYYSLDLLLRLGEGVASSDQVWVQPPGTPTVGMAYLRAYEATGDPFYLDAATETAEALIYGQLKSGGWTNCIDFNPSGQRVSLYRNGKGSGRNYSSLDDDQTQSAIRFLIQADRAHRFQHKAIHEAATIALGALLKAQFANGALPQGWGGPVDQNKPVLRASLPKYDWRTEGHIKNYWDMYTLNDGLAGTVAQVLIEAHQTYGDARYKAALARLGDFLVLAQLPEPQPAWAQQYNYDMHPIWARKFEPAAVSGRESQDVMETLLTISEYCGDRKYREPVPRALAYLRRSLLPDGRLARYYELASNRPLYMKRRGDVYTLTYDDSDLPSHYGWKTVANLDEIEARYKALEAGDRRPAKPVSPDLLARQVRAIIDALDAQGRWITTSKGEPLVGQPKFRPGEQFISSAVFSVNLTTLSEYLRAGK
jgi:PelA/Pel-15E family pectate lyase